MRNIFFENHSENETGKLVLDIVLFFEQALYEVKESDRSLSLVSIYFGSQWLGHTVKANCVKLYTVDPEIYSILIF